jgi:hypothetical protein
LELELVVMLEAATEVLEEMVEWVEVLLDLNTML